MDEKKTSESIIEGAKVMLHIKLEGPFPGEVRIDSKWETPGPVMYLGLYKKDLRDEFGKTAGMFGHIINPDLARPSDVYAAALRLGQLGSVEFLSLPDDMTKIGFPSNVQS